MRLPASPLLFRLLAAASFLPVFTTFAASVSFDIPSQPADTALRKFSRQAKVEVLFPSDELKRVRSRDLKGEFEPSEALSQLLTGSGYSAEQTSPRNFVVAADRAQKTGHLDGSVRDKASRPVIEARVVVSGTGITALTDRSGGFVLEDVPAGTHILAIIAEGKQNTRVTDVIVRPGQRQTLSPILLPARVAGVVQLEDYIVSAKKNDAVVELDPYEVSGQRAKPFTTANMDLPRTIDDAQAYYIFDAKTIDLSSSNNVEEFLRRRLTMSASSSSAQQTPASANGSISTGLNLNALGSNQTLILINGRRAAGFPGNTGVGNQPNLNGIALSSIDHIEVLPSSASAIYGSNAVGGVINVILKRDYTGGEVKTTYQNTFDGDAAIKSVDLFFGMSLEGGRTSLSLSAAYSDQNKILFQDRDFVQRNRAQAVRNAPETVFPPTTLTPPYLASTPNIVSMSGAPLFGAGTPAFTYVPKGYAGGGGLAPLQVNAGKYNLELGNFPGSAGAWGGLQTLLVPERRASFSLGARRQFLPKLELFLEFQNSAVENNMVGSAFFQGAYTVNANAPNNPFGQAVRVVTALPDFVDPNFYETKSLNRRIAGGFILTLPREWKVEADYTWNFSRASANIASSPTSTISGTPIPTVNGLTLTNAIATGVIDVFRDSVAYPFNRQLTPYWSRLYGTFDSTLTDITGRAFGPVWRLPAGAVNLTLGLSHRREGTDDGFYKTDTNVGDSGGIWSSGKSQTIDSAYVETLIPLVSPSLARPGVHLLDVQVAVRREDFSVRTGTANISYNQATGLTAAQLASIFSSTSNYRSTNPTVGGRYKPAKDIMLRGTYTKGFLAPTYSQLAASPSPANSAVMDPRRGNASTSVPTYATRNASLLPEESENWNAGIVFTPRQVKGLRVALDYMYINKTNQITSLAAQTVLANESFYPDRVVRGPVPAGDIYGVGPVTQINTGNVNLTKAYYESVNYAVDYRLTTSRRGSWMFNALATNFLTMRRPVAAGVLNAPLFDFVSRPTSGPLKWNFNAGVNWELRRWSAGWNARYFDSYYEFDNYGVTPPNTLYVARNGGPTIPSQIYHDFVAGYSFPAAGKDARWYGRALDRSALQIGIKNVFNHVPPPEFLEGSTAGYSGYGDARLREYVITLRRPF